MISALIVCAALSVVDGGTIKCDEQNMLLLEKASSMFAPLETTIPAQTT